jgi:hypothetical protein
LHVEQLDAVRAGDTGGNRPHLLNDVGLTRHSTRPDREKRTRNLKKNRP